MFRLRPILSLVFALAFCVPSQLRRDDVLCIENTGKISLGCSEIIDFPVYPAGQGVRVPSDCAPCTDVQINWSTTKDVANLTLPAISPSLVPIPPSEKFVVLSMETPTFLLDTGPVATPAPSQPPFRC